MKLKRTLSVILASVSVVLLSGSAYADADVRASVMFASDYQFYKNYTPQLFGDMSITSCEPVVEALAEQIYLDGHDVETVVIGGDYTQNDNNKDMSSSYDTALFGDELQYHYGNNPQYSMDEIERAINAHLSPSFHLYVQGNHDPDIYTLEGLRCARTGAHEFEDYYVYILNDQDFVGERPRTKVQEYTNIVPDSIMNIDNPDEVVARTANDLKSFLESLVEKADSRPVFICSHQPLHYTENNYNGNAYQIFDAINDAAENLDIIFFFGHTHDKSDDIGGGLSYVEPGDVMNICTGGNGSNTFEARELNFYYMNYGHLARYQGVNEYLSSTVVDVTKYTLEINRFIVGADKINYTVYRKNPASDKGVEIVLTLGSKDALVNGQLVTNDVAPKAVNSRTMLPIRFIVEALGATVGWVQETNSVLISKQGLEIALSVGDKFATVNGERVELDVESFAENGRTYLPLRFVSERLGASVKWDGNTQKVTITAQ